MQFNKIIAPAAALVCALSAPLHAADDAISLIKETVTCMEEMNAKLDTVKDEASANAAAADIEKIVAKATDIQSRIMKATPPTSPEAAQEAMALQTKIQDVAVKCQTNLQRIAQANLMTPELTKALTPKAQPAPAATDAPAAPAATETPAAPAAPAAETPAAK